jgi:hypothetical protein
MSQVIEQRIATLLGNFGLFPFFVLAVAAWMPLSAVPARLVELAFVGYAAVILSFLGAVHWGLALLTPQLTKPQAWNAFGWGVLPALLGWLALLLAMAGVRFWIVCLVLATDFLLCRRMDSRLLSQYPDAPAWYSALRTRLTLGVLLALAIALPSALPA